MVLGAAESTGDLYQRIIWASLIVIGMVIGAFVLVSLLRRKLREDDDASGTGGTGFTLSDLRALHKSGQMSDQEFEAAKGKMVASARRATERDGTAAAGHRQPRPGPAVEAEPPPPGAGERPSSTD